MEYKILVAEDDKSLNQGICLALRKEEFSFIAAYTLAEAKEACRTEQPDMILLDVNFPDGNGFDFLRSLRRFSDVPVLMITANDMETDEVTGLTLGADDYIAKPFSLMALRARVEAIRRRMTRPSAHIYGENGYRFDFERLEFFADGQEIILSAPEQKLLRLFVTHSGQTLPREMLIRRVWTDSTEYIDENALSVTVSRLRKKLKSGDKSCPITTVYGIGYVWK